MPRPPVQLSPALRLLLAFAALTTAPACKTRGLQSGVKEAAAPNQAAEPVDVNDVSLLFPLPRHIADLGTMLPLSLTTDAGKPVMSEALFNDVVGHFKYTATIAGKQVKLDSGAVFVFDKGRHPKEKDVGPFNNYKDWKIVAMRYDPCAPTAMHNLRGAAMETHFLHAFDANACQPQLRLSIQPILDLGHSNPVNADGSSAAAALNRDTPHAADYAMHLLFKLTEADSREIFQRLLDFRQACGGVTSGMPLMVQPCLAAERLKGTAGLPRQQDLAAIIKKYANTYTGIAAMATQTGDDPWFFMNGGVEDDKFQHGQIDAVTKVKNLVVNKNGVVIEPFSNGYYQMLSFLNVGTSTPGGAALTKNIRVTPTAYPDKVNVSLVEEFNENFIDLSNAALAADFHDRINHVENPAANDFFSTDCVSCHGAANLGYIDITRGDQALTEAFFSAKRGRSSQGTVLQSSIPDPMSSGFALRFSGSGVFSPGSYMNVVDPISVTHSINRNPYGLIHFGYLDVRPSISVRAANESAKVAWQANQFYGSGRDPGDVCAKQKLQQCLYEPVTLQAGLGWSDTLTDDQNWDINLRLVSACMNQVCPERAKQIAGSFGEHWGPQFKTIRDVPITSMLPEEGLYIPKGTILQGYRVDGYSTYAGDPDAKKVLFFYSPVRIPVKSKDGRDWYGSRAIPPDGSWEQNFEAVL